MYRIIYHPSILHPQAIRKNANLYAILKKVFRNTSHEAFCKARFPESR